MKLAQILLVLILSAAVSFGVVKLTAQQTSSVASKESVYDRVLRPNELRCGYSVYAPYFTKDAATGQFGGIWHDVTEAIGDHLGVKIVWAEEVGLGEISTALDNGRIDMFCGGLWTAGKRVRAVDFLEPTAYEPMLVYVRGDDHRFDDNLTSINDPAVKIATIDGEGGGLVAMEEFPRATFVSLPQMSGYPELFNQVAQGKADALLSAPSGAAAYMKSNPGILRPASMQAVRIFPVGFVIAYGDNKLRDMVDTAQSDIINNGILEKILSKDEVNKGDFWRPVKPYSAVEK
jgi:polar amino acid transport system substrate-binding protein